MDMNMITRDLADHFLGLCTSAYEKGVPGVPGSPLSDLKPVGLWRHPEALRGSLKPSEAR